MNLRRRLFEAVVACGTLWVLVFATAAVAASVADPEPLNAALSVGALCAVYLLVRCVDVDVPKRDGDGTAPSEGAET